MHYVLVNDEGEIVALEYTAKAAIDQSESASDELYEDGEKVTFCHYCKEDGVELWEGGEVYEAGESRNVCVNCEKEMRDSEDV